MVQEKVQNSLIQVFFKSHFLPLFCCLPLSLPFFDCKILLNILWWLALLLIFRFLARPSFPAPRTLHVLFLSLFHASSPPPPISFLHSCSVHATTSNVKKSQRKNRTLKAIWTLFYQDFEERWAEGDLSHPYF